MSAEETKYELPHIIKLGYPVSHGNDMIEEMVVKRRLTTKDLNNFPTEDIKLGDMFKLCGKVTQEHQNLIDKLDPQDTMKIVAVVKTFLPRSMQSGEDK